MRIHRTCPIGALFLLTTLLGCGGGSTPDKGVPPPPPVIPTASCTPTPSSALVFNVKDAPYGALGNGVANDTAAIQRAVDAMAGKGGTVLIPAGTYLVDVTVAIKVKSGLTLQMDPATVLKAIPTSDANTEILLLSNVSNVNILGGTLEGERAGHTGTTGEWGHGLSLIGASHVVVSGVTAKECWGDGFYIGGGSTDITLCGVVGDHNRRQGISITRADSVALLNCTFKNTAGTPGQTGCDIEPNAGETVSNVLISHCTFANNAGGGIATGVPIANTGTAFVYNIVIDGNTCTGNGIDTITTSSHRAIEVSNSSGTQVSNNTCTSNTGDGIVFRDGANYTRCTGNTVTGTLGTPGNGIVEYQCSGNTITGNTATGNAGHGIYSVSCTASTITGNTVSGNGQTP